MHMIDCRLLHMYDSVECIREEEMKHENTRTLLIYVIKRFIELPQNLSEAVERGKKLSEGSFILLSE